MKISELPALPLAGVIVLSCGGAVERELPQNGPHYDEGAAGDSSGVGYDGGAAAGAGATNDSGGESVTAAPSCKRSCVITEDCAGRLESRNADNWICADEICVFLGCRSDDECVADWGADMRCASRASGGVPDCLSPCATAADCDHRTDPRFYECRDSLCHFMGCASDAQCESIYPGSVCDKAASPPYCAPKCENSSECRRPSSRGGPILVMHYEQGECVDSVCVYPDCSDSEECGPGSVCR